MFHHYVVVPPSARRRSPSSAAAIAAAAAIAVHRPSIRSPPFIKEQIRGQGMGQMRRWGAAQEYITHRSKRVADAVEAAMEDKHGPGINIRWGTVVEDDGESCADLATLVPKIQPFYRAHLLNDDDWWQWLKFAGKGAVQFPLRLIKSSHCGLQVSMGLTAFWYADHLLGVSVCDGDLPLINAVESCQSRQKVNFNLKTSKDVVNADVPELTNKLQAVSRLRPASIESSEAANTRVNQLGQLKSTTTNQEAWQEAIDKERNQYKTVSDQLILAKQQLKYRKQDFDIALEAKLASFQRAAVAQSAAKLNCTKIDCLRNANSKERVETRSLDETSEVVNALRDQLKEEHDADMDVLRNANLEVEEAKKRLEEIKKEETSVRDVVESLKQELENVKRDIIVFKGDDLEEGKEAKELADDQIRSFSTKDVVADDDMMDNDTNLNSDFDSDTPEHQNSTIKLTTQDFEALSRKVEEATTAADTKVATIMYQVETIKQKEKGIIENLEKSMQESNVFVVCVLNLCRISLQKFVEMSLFLTVEDSRNNFSKTETSALGPQPSQLDPAIKYNTPPEKVPQVEQQDSIELENLPFLSEEDKPSVVRSCAPIRSTTPRRSTYPMRCIQIGRSRSRRVTQLTIKSLNYFPVREKAAFQRDAGNNSDEEDHEKPSKNHVLRMSVPHNVAVEAESNLHFMESHIRDSNAQNIKPPSPKPEPRGVKGDTLQTEKEESCEKHPASIESNHQQHVFTNMMENKNKTVRIRNSTSDVGSKNKKSPKMNKEWHKICLRDEREPQRRGAREVEEGAHEG
ncbi:hypothetical protein Tco_0416912 [Tanacetum coccineum]